MEKQICLIVKKSKTGRGVYTNKNFKKGETILIPRGKILTKEQINEKRDSKWFMAHSVQIGENLFMGPANDIEDYVNHSCGPNAGHMIKERKSKFVAIRNIKKGQEVTFDYSTTMFNSGKEMKCLCGNKNCRKLIQDFNYLPKKLQKKYLSLGIVPPYIITGLR